MSYATAILTGTYQHFNGDPAEGVVEIIPNSKSLIDSEGNVILTGRVKVTLDEAGSFSVVLPATDDATVEPALDRQYTVVAKLRHQHLPAVTGIELPGGSTLDMADLTTAEEAVAGFSVWLTEEEYTALEATVAGKADTASLATVATSGAYTDLTAKPTIPTTPAEVGAEPAGLSAATEAGLAATFASGVSLPASNGTDDTAAIQAVLDAHAGKRIVGKPGETYRLSEPLVLQSGTTLEMYGTTVVLNDLANCNMLVNEALTASRTAIGASVTAASTAITVTEAAFTAADVGKPITVWGAGPQGRPLDTTIAAVTDGTTATLATAALTTVTGQTVTIGPRDTNITVMGGVWDRGSVSGDNLDLHLLRFRRVDGLIVRDVFGRSQVGKYFINPADCRHTTIENVGCDTHSDGVHLNGPIRGCIIRNVWGSTGDDMVSLTPADYPQYNDCRGDITDVTLEDIHADITGIGASTGASFAGLPVKILGGNGHSCERIRVKRVSGYIPTADGGVWIGDDTGEALTSGGLLDDITVEDVNVAHTSGAASVVLRGTNIQRVKVSGVHADHDVQGNGLVWVANGTTVHSLAVRNLSVSAMGASSHTVRVDGTVNNLVIDGVSGDDLGYVLYLPLAASRVDRCTISNVIASNGSGVVQASTAGTTLPKLSVFNVQMASSSWGIGDIATTTEVQAANISTTPIVHIFNLRATANITVRAANCNFGGKSVQGNTGYVIASKSLDFPVDVSLLVRNNGDQAYNINAALSCGVGPVVCNGTTWKNLYTDATY